MNTLLILSGTGALLTLLLTAAKPFVSGFLPASWQRTVWICVALLMLIPVYRLIPAHKPPQIVIDAYTPVADTIVQWSETEVERPATSDTTDVAKENTKPTPKPTAGDIAAGVWICGVLVYSGTVAMGYVRYRRYIKKSSRILADTSVFDETKTQLGIRRQVSVYTVPGIQSPMLMGLLRPAVYIPEMQLSPQSLAMVYLHELTHCKRRDLLFKWLAVAVNAVHWFNPAAYILCKRLGDACELACDEAVTRDMTDNDKKEYTKTILLLAEKGVEKQNDRKPLHHQNER